MNYLIALIVCLTSFGCSNYDQYEIVKENEIQKLDLIVNKLGFNEERQTYSSCGYTIQQLEVMENQFPSAIVFRIYPISTGHGTLVVQLVTDDKGKPGKSIINEWIITHDCSKSLSSDSVLLHFSKTLPPGTYWFRFIDSHTEINTLTFNCQLVSDNKLIRYYNSEGYHDKQIIGFGLVSNVAKKLQDEREKKMILRKK